MKNKPTITREEWDSLKPGDVLLWRGSKLRTVIEGPRFSGSGIYLSKLARGLYGAMTCYGFNDIKHLVIKTGSRRRTVVSKAEKAAVEALGWNFKREFVRLLKDHRDRKIRMGRELCDRKFVLP